MDKDTLLAAVDFSRGRLLGLLDTIEKSGQDTPKVLAWRPAPGRAHIAWQAMHCAATHDRYIHSGILKVPVKYEALVRDFAGGSTPSDTNVPTMAAIRDNLSNTLTPLRNFISDQTKESLAKVIVAPGGKDRTIAEAIHVLIWHEAHHQGQIHLTWNMYKAAHGVA